MFLRDNGNDHSATGHRSEAAGFRFDPDTAQVIAHFREWGGPVFLVTIAGKLWFKLQKTVNKRRHVLPLSNRNSWCTAQTFQVP